MKLVLENLPERLEVTVEVFDPSLRPDNEDWRLALLLRGALASVRSAQRITTERGWPATVIEAVVDGGQAVLGVFYELLCFVAAVVVRAPSAASLADQRDEILRIITAGRPDFSGGEPVALAELLA
jgi:hypothetical protein